jgi:peptidyl-prolyl cis-trans isomerase C
MKLLLLLLPPIFLIASSANAFVAKINDREISKEFFEKKYKETSKFFVTNPPSKKAFLDDLIKREVAILEAKRLGLDKDAEIIDRMNTVLSQALLERALSKEIENIHITNAVAESYYATNPEIRLSHIFIGVPPGASSETEKKSRDRIGVVSETYLKKEKMSFPEAAQRFSEGPEAAMGGDLDYQTKDRLDPVLYQAAKNLRTPGTVSGIIRSRYGFHILKLTAIRSWKEVDQAKIKRLVFDESRQKLMDNYVNQLKAKTKISINESALGK